MTEWHLKSKRKKTGGIRKSRRRSDKKLAWKGGKAAGTLLSKKDERKSQEGRGSTAKSKLSKASVAIVSEKGRASKAKIVAVRKNIANRHFERRQVITKGAEIEVEIAGTRKLARVMNRPGQHGTVQAVVVSEKIESAKPRKAGKEEKPPEQAETAENKPEEPK